MSFTPNINSPRYYRLYSQIQSTAYNTVNNGTGTWTNTGVKLLRVDEGSFTANRSAPYTRFPVLTGSRSEVAGVRGRKNGPAWSIRGMPICPSGAAGTAPDMDSIFANIFGATATLVASTSAAYSFSDTAISPLSLFFFNHPNPSTMTSAYYWGAFIRQFQINFNANFLTIDVDGFFGWGATSTTFSSTDLGGAGQLTTFPAEPVSPTTLGTPIAGFGTGYTMTIASQDISLKTRVLSITGETGWVPIQDVYGSPYPIAAVGDTRRMAIALGALDDDSSALNTLKTDTEQNTAVYVASVVAGATAGSIMTATLNNIQLNTFNLTDQGAVVAFDLPTSYAHATSAGAVDDMTLVFT